MHHGRHHRLHEPPDAARHDLGVASEPEGDADAELAAADVAVPATVAREEDAQSVYILLRWVQFL